TRIGGEGGSVRSRRRRRGAGQSPHDAARSWSHRDGNGLERRYCDAVVAPPVYQRQFVRSFRGAIAECRMNYSLQTLLHERTRYAAGVGAVAFSAVLMALQFGLMLGLFTITSIPID